ncbi:MAG: alpha/beta hydrolase [Planctomycetota bacterium]
MGWLNRRILAVALVGAAAALAPSEAKAQSSAPMPRRLLAGGISGQGEYGPWQTVTNNAVTVWLTRVASPASIAAQREPSGVGTFFILALEVPATNELELFSLHVPAVPSGSTRPLLTCFHVAGASHLDIWFNTSYFREAIRRDWFCVAPLQRNLAPGTDAQISYASAQSQLHVEAVIDFVTQSFAVDLERLYGVGFSMGGGNALSYAARHRDPSRGAFAAVVNHTGTVALGNVYGNVPTAIRDQLDVIFSGTPTTAPFGYQRSSLIELDPNGGLLAGGRHMATNLRHVPVRSYFNPIDPLGYLVRQTQQLDVFFDSLPPSIHDLQPRLSGCHCWATIDDFEVCEWLDQWSLTSPSSGSLLCDRSGRWEQFEVALDCADCFGAFDYTLEEQSNRVLVLRTEGIESVEIDLVEAGFATSAPKLFVETSSIDGTDTRLVFRGLSAPPARVFRNTGELTTPCVPGPGAASWCWDAATLTLEIVEPAGAGGDWELLL